MYCVALKHGILKNILLVHNHFACAHCATNQKFALIPHIQIGTENQNLVVVGRIFAVQHSNQYLILIQFCQSQQHKKYNRKKQIMADTSNIVLLSQDQLRQAACSNTYPKTYPVDESSIN